MFKRNLTAHNRWIWLAIARPNFALRRNFTYPQTLDKMAPLIKNIWRYGKWKEKY